MNQQSIPDYMPLPEEIRERAAEIRAGWSPRLEELRRVIRQPEAVNVDVIQDPKNRYGQRISGYFDEDGT